MQKAEFVQEREVDAKLCPFCYGRLKMREMIQLKVRKVCICSKCGKKINKRNVWV